VGQTCRNLLHRVKEHKYAVTKGHSSAIADHAQSGHSVCFENAKIIHSEHNLQKRLIAEPLLIRNNSTFINNKASFELQIFN